MVPQLTAADDPLGIHFVPQPGCLHPMAVRFEFRDIDCPSARTGALHQGRQANKPPLAARARPRTVEYDAEQPGDDTGAALERTDAGKYSQPGVLDHFLGLGAAADDRGGDADERSVEPPDQPPVGMLIAASQAGEEFRLIELGLAH